MLAKRRSLMHNGREVDRTPLLVPSFSSKGFPDVDKIIKYSSELIAGVALISAYDLHYDKIKPPFDFPSLERSPSEVNRMGFPNRFYCDS
jgi:hypothetical protein